MAKLPDATAFGAVDAGPSGRPVATYDTTGFSRGAAAMGAGAEKLGEGIEKGAKGVGAYFQHEQEADDKLDLARAKSSFLTGKVQTDETYKDDKDDATLATRYGADIDKVHASASAQIRNPRTRELFDLSVSDDVAKAKSAAANAATTIWKDNTLADGNSRLEEIRNAALKSSDPEERTKLINSGNDLISSLADKNIITRTKATEASKEWTTKYAAGAISMLPPEDRVKALGGFEQTLINRESSGRPGLVNQLGYAGLYQFGAPRVADLGIYKPGPGENLDGWSKTGKDAPGKWTGTFSIPGHPEVRTIADFLKSPDAQKEAFQLHTAKMDQEAKSMGLDKYIGQTVGGTVITREGLQAMMHLGGAGGAKRALESDGANSPKDANGTSVIEYAKLGSQSGATKIASLLPEDTRVRMQHEAQQQVDQGVVKAAAAQSEVWERKIIDSTAGIGALPNRKDIETDPALDEPRRNVLLRQHDAAAGDVAGLNNFMTKFKDPAAGAFNPYDADEKKYADVAYKSLGGDTPALQAVVSRTGIMPKSAAAALKGDLISTNPDRVASALTLSSNLISANPNILTGVEGRADIENNAVKFRHYVDDLGMTAQDAAKNFIRDQSPEYQAKVKARIKTEDVDAKIKKELSIGDLASQFDQSWIPFNDPKVGFSVGARQAMFGQYAELVKDAYLDSANGDMSVAKKQAADQLKKTWGVSTINGSSVVMQYPPERAPAYANIPNPADVIAKQAVQAVREETAGPAIKAVGVVEPGNIDLSARPVVKQKDGSIATVKSVSVNMDGKETLIPTISDDGRELSVAQAVDQYRQTGKHLGKFDTPQQATAYAKQLSAQQGKLYGTEVDRKNIRLTPIPGATAAAYKAGQPVPYDMSWEDKNGVVQTLSPGRAFVADPVAMRGEVVAERKAVVEAGQAAADKAGDEKLIGTADRFLSQKQRVAKKALIESRANADVAAGAGEVGDIAGGTMDPAIAAAASNALPSRPAGRMGPAR